MHCLPAPRIQWSESIFLTHNPHQTDRSRPLHHKSLRRILPHHPSQHTYRRPYLRQTVRRTERLHLHHLLFRFCIQDRLLRQRLGLRQEKLIHRYTLLRRERERRAIHCRWSMDRQFHHQSRQRPRIEKGRADRQLQCENRQNYPSDRRASRATRPHGIKPRMAERRSRHRQRRHGHRAH